MLAGDFMANKFNLSQLMNDKSKPQNDKETAFKIENIAINKIKPSTMNKYSVDDVTKLKTNIEFIGLQQNLLVRKIKDSDDYELISGHRRFKAMSELYTEGNEKFSKVPCKIIECPDDIQAELQLIFANSTSRQLTDYEKTYQAGRIKELLLELKKGGYKFGGRMREVVAEFLKVSPAQIGRMESINNNLSTEFKEEFKDSNINITTAYELSKLDDEQQKEALQEHKTVAPLTPSKAKKHNRYEMSQTKSRLKREEKRKEPSAPPKEQPKATTEPQSETTERKKGASQIDIMHQLIKKCQKGNTYNSIEKYENGNISSIEIFEQTDEPEVEKLLYTITHDNESDKIMITKWQ